MLNKLKELAKANASNLILLGLVLILGGLTLHLSRKNNIKSASVMIVSRSMDHGGTGIILSSTPSKTSILTNDHVCRAIKDGGVVRSNNGDYQVASMVESELSDLCLVQVLANLGVNNKISNSAPNTYDNAVISGHPALMPNVLSTGHVSGRRIIDVMTGIRPCTKEEASGPLGLACFFFGGLPVIQSFESVLVTATIMPGSSGSGVYNTKGELIGVVFAGSEGFGYAWTVPYEQVVNFLYEETKHLKTQNLSQEISLFSKTNDSKKLKQVLQKCESATQEVIVNYCEILKRDMTWVK